MENKTMVDNLYNSFISVSPNGKIAAAFNSESFTINFYEIENLTTPTVITCDEIRNFVSSSPSVKVSYSLAISNTIRIRGKDDVLIAISCFCDKDMMKEMKRINDYSMTNQDLTDVEKGDDFNKKSATFVISMNLKTRIETIFDTRGGVVKFLESTNLIVMNASGITKTSINHDDSYAMNITNEYEFPVIIQDKIDNLYQDIPCTCLLQNSIVSNYLFAENYRNKKVEMYNLKSSDLEIIFQKRNEFPLLTSLLKNPIFCISNHGHLLAHCSSAKNITIYLMENGLEIITKEFNDANRILLVSFIDDDEKLFVVTEEASGLMISIWDIFTYKGDIRKIADNTNILNSLQEGNYHSLAISNGAILASLQNGTVFSVLDHSDVKYILKPSDELRDLLPIDVENAQQANLLESHSEPWVNYKQTNYISSYLDEEIKTIQLIIGKTTVQVWRKRSHNSKTKQVLEYIWANQSNERIEVTSLKVGNREFILGLSIMKIHWPNETHILKDACDAIKYLYERKYEVRQENQEKYEKLIRDTEKIIKKCIKKNPDLWRLSEIRYEIMTNLIQAKRVLLLHQILFNFREFNKIDTNGVTNIIKVNRYLHIPRQYSWPTKEKNSDLEISIDESSDEEKSIVAMLLEYYSNNAEKDIGWMFTITKAIPSLNKRHLKGCLKELFYKPCFGAKEEYLNSKFVSKFVSQNELKKGYNKRVYALNIKPQLLEKKNSDKHSWRNIKNIMRNINNDENTYHATTAALRVVPLPDFTIYSTNAIKPQNRSILLKLFKLIFWPKNYLSNVRQSPFLKFLSEEENKILYDNPSIEACIEFKWNSSRNYFLWHLLKFIVFSAIFFSFFSLYYNTLTSQLSLLIIFHYLGYHLLVIEIAQFINEGKKYLNIYNIFDVVSVITPMISIYYLGSFALLMLLLEITLLLRMFSRIANYINIVLNILKAVLPFILFMLFLAFAFGIAMNRFFYTKNVGGFVENTVKNYTQDFDFSNPITDFIYLFIGKFDNFSDNFFWPIFLLSISASVMLILVMQNLLIAVMTNIYENAKSNARLVALKCRGDLIVDYEKTEKLFRKERENQRYIYYIGNSDYQEEWLKKAKEYRESHRSLFVEDISNQLLNDSSSNDESDDDEHDNNNDNNNNNNADDKILKLQEEMLSLIKKKVLKNSL